MQFDIQRHASTAWTTPAASSLRLKVYTDRDGNIAVTGATVTGSKSITIGYVLNSASAGKIYNNESDDAVSPTGTAGIVTIFFDYLLSNHTNIYNMSKSVTMTPETAA